MKKSEEFSDNDNADYFDEYDRIHNSLYQNGFLQHVFNGSLSTDDVGDDNQNVEIFQKSFEHNKNTNTSSSKSSSSNQSERANLLPHYQPRWHQQLNQQSLPIRNPLHPSIIKAHLDSVNHEIAQLDSRIENVLLKQHHASQAVSEAERNATIYRNPVDLMVNASETKPIVTSTNNTTTVISSSPTASLDNKFGNLCVSASTPTGASVGKSILAPRRLPAQFPSNPPIMDSDTEHIYETIPEDSESEPIYCSPYKSENASEQDLVEEWLNMNDNQKRSVNNKTAWARSTKSNSSHEDHENSSSAYNTGGSCNSNHQLTLELNDSNNGKDGNKTLVFCPTKHLQPQYPMQQESKPSGNRSSATKKEKVLSPTHNNRRSQNQVEQATSKKSNSQGK